jgi:hypothetical protein
MEADPRYEGRVAARQATTEVFRPAPEPEVAGTASRTRVPNVFTRLARFSPHTRRWHVLDRASGGRLERADDDTAEP